MVTSDLDELTRQFTALRPRLTGIAYRITGTHPDAEDAVQEAWLRLAALDDRRRSEIRSLSAWLATTVARICLDRLRSATVRREQYVGSWLPEPIVTPLEGRPDSNTDNPLDAVVRDEDVRLATMAVLHGLTPEQRVAFVLHDVLDLPFAEIAGVLDCSPVTARQHASRGRRRLSEADLPPVSSMHEQQQALRSLATAIGTGDVTAVVGLLHPDVVMVGDGGGAARTALHPITGAPKVARFLLGLVEMYGLEGVTGGRPVLVNGELGLVVTGREATGGYRGFPGRVAAVAVRDGLILGIYDIASPDKLRRVDLS